MAWPQKDDSKFHWLVYVGLVESSLIMAKSHGVVYTLNDFNLKIHDRKISLEYM